MLQMLESEIEVLIESGFIFLPLKFDPFIEEDLEAVVRSRSGHPESAGQANVIAVNGKHYVRSLSIRGILDNYAKFDPETYEYIRRGVFNRFLRTLNPSSLSMDEKLGAIVFQVMPYFLRKKDRLHRKPVLGEEVLDLVSRRLDIPPIFYHEAGKYSDTATLRKRLQTLSAAEVSDIPFTGLVAAKTVRQWFFKALEAKVIEAEKRRLGSLLYNQEQFSKLQKKYIAVLLFVKAQGALEINGCGFFRGGTSSEYLVYVRTGEFALKDFYGRIYLFPDCRVGVSTTGPLVPYVLDRYKHPFLKGYDTLQKICVRGDFAPMSKFNAVGAIQAIEEGLSALFHGYNSRRGNGYHRLDGMKIEENSIVFEEYRIEPNDPRFAAGELEIKNDFY